MFASLANKGRERCPATLGPSTMDASVDVMPRGARARPQDIDRHVGRRIRERRLLLGLTQMQLADLIGVTYQQAHKYEAGVNRVSAGRLGTIANALGVEPGWFFEGVGIGAPAGL